MIDKQAGAALIYGRLAVLKDEPPPLTDEELDVLEGAAVEVDRQRMLDTGPNAEDEHLVGLEPNEVFRLVAEVRRLRARPKTP